MNDYSLKKKKRKKTRAKIGLHIISLTVTQVKKKCNAFYSWGVKMKGNFKKMVGDKEQL